MHLLTAGKIKQLENAALNEAGIFSARLMDAAAQSLYDALIENAPHPVEDVLILCGGGNNGADGYTLAAICREHGLKTSVISVFEPQSPLCRERAYSCNTLDSPLFSFESDRALCESLIEKASVVIDCVFGIGYDTTREADPRFLSLCRMLSKSHAFIISADVPSGLDADTGLFRHEGSLPALIFADLTVTFTASKPALETAPGLHAAGKVKVADVGIPAELLEKTKSDVRFADKSTLRFLKPRENDTSKANYGKLFSYCGSRNMPGAALLSATGALRCGVGLLTCASTEDALSVLKTRLCEPIYLPICETFDAEIDLSKTKDSFIRRLATQSAALVGCGIGTAREQEILLECILQETSGPVICDADALTILSSRDDLLETFGEKLILTPHPGEMARLCRIPPNEVQLKRIPLAKQLAKKYGCVVILKGYRTVIASPDGRLSICPHGNPGMAKAGMGDLLAGMVASFAAQKIPAYDAACLAVYLHARAGDLANALLGEASLLPSDVAKFISKAITE